MSASQLLMTGFAILVSDVDVLEDDVIAAKSTIKPTEANFMDGAVTVSGDGIQTMRITLQRQ